MKGNDSQGYKSVDYPKLTAVLIEAIKELNAENAMLKSQMNVNASNLDAQQSKFDLLQLKMEMLSSQLQNIASLLSLDTDGLTQTHKIQK